MSELYKQREIRMKKALDAFFKNSYKSAAVCVREFDVLSRLFQQRLRFEEKFNSRGQSSFYYLIIKN